MKFSGTLKLTSIPVLASISILLGMGLAACDNRGTTETSRGPAETTGENIDRSLSNAGNKIEQTADNVGDSMERQGERTGQALDDAAITAKVKAAIFAEPSLKTLQISVDTVQGVVSLTGSVDSQEERNRAKALASAVDGVKVVENRLALK